MDKSWSRCPIIRSINPHQNSGKTSINIKNCLSWSWIRKCKTWGLAELCGSFTPSVKKNAWSYLVVGQGYKWFNMWIGDLYWFKWDCCTCGSATVNSFVVLTKLEFDPDYTYQWFYSWLNYWKEFSIGNNILSDLSPAVSPL